MPALDGLLVIALEQAVAGPLCTQRLADGGARVIKIEREGGETARHYDSTVQGTSAHFAWLNRGKESAVLDIKTADDFAVLKQMLGKADVLVQNLAPGALGRLGLTANVLEQEFPHLIVLSIMGYGQDTPYADMRAYDLLVQAESGICSVTGPPEKAVKVGVSVADIGTGMAAHAAVLEALIERGQTGKGKHIEIALFDVMSDWMAVPSLHQEQANKSTERHGLAHATIYPYGPFPCADGTVLIAVQTQREWQSLCEQVLEAPDLIHDPAFTTNPDRDANRKALNARINPICQGFTKAKLIERLKSAGIAYGELREVTDLATHPARRTTNLELPDGSEATAPRPPGRTKELPKAIPAVGDQTQSLREEFAP